MAPGAAGGGAEPGGAEPGAGEAPSRPGPQAEASSMLLACCLFLLVFWVGGTRGTQVTFSLPFFGVLLRLAWLKVDGTGLDGVDSI